MRVEGGPFKQDIEIEPPLHQEDSVTEPEVRAGDEVGPQLNLETALPPLAENGDDEPAPDELDGAQDEAPAAPDEPPTAPDEPDVIAEEQHVVAEEQDGDAEEQDGDAEEQEEDQTSPPDEIIPREGVPASQEHASQPYASSPQGFTPQEKLGIETEASTQGAMPATPARPEGHEGGIGPPPPYPYPHGPPPMHYPGYGSPMHGHHAYYPPHMFGPPPPPPGEGGAPAPFLPRGYEGGPPPTYGYPGPPPGYPPYPITPYMYPPPYPQHPMYGGHAPHHLAPHPHYPYGGHEHPGSRYGLPPGVEDHNAAHPYGRPDARPDLGRGSEKNSRGSFDQNDSVQQDDDGEEEGGDMGGGTAVSNRLKTYIKPRIPSTQEVLDRRARKNAQSRARAGRLRGRIGDIEKKTQEERDEEEAQLWAQYEARRRRKNDRSRERALEKKEEIDRILAKPEKKRTKIEKQFLETALSAKKRKNEGDRLRRSRLKDLGLSTKGTGVKPGVSARGPLPPQYQGAAPGYGGHHMAPPPGDIPMSPLPSVPPHHYGHPYPQSPGTFVSPGLMNMGFSPRRHATPGRHDPSMPYMPGPHGYDGRSPDPSGTRGSHGQPSSSRVEQRRNPDGSVSISIGGSNTNGPPFGGEGQSADGEDDEANMMMENQDDDGDGDGEGSDEGNV